MERARSVVGVFPQGALLFVWYSSLPNLEYWCLYWESGP